MKLFKKDAEEYRREDLSEALNMLVRNATPRESAEIARIVITTATTSFGGGEDEKRETLLKAVKVLADLEDML